jgi:hypothetical protein
VFTQNKRYRQDRPQPDGVVNRNVDSVYQTDAISISTAGTQPMLRVALKSTTLGNEYVDAQKTPSRARHECACSLRNFISS